MKKRWIGYALLSTLFFVAFLVAKAPATLVVKALTQASNGVLTLNSATGTVWNGQGELVLHRLSGPSVSLGLASWRINPLWLFAARAQVSIELSGAEARVRGDVGVTFSGTVLRDVDAEFPASLAAVVYPPAALASLGGTLHLKTERFSLPPKRLTGDAALEWRKASSNFSSVRPLGDYVLKIAGQNAVANIRLETIRGDLQLSGTGKFYPVNQKIEFTGTASAVGQKEQIEPLLRMLGSPGPNGSRSFAFSGSP